LRTSVTVSSRKRSRPNASFSSFAGILKW
jgi:hypothetical protein